MIPDHQALPRSNVLSRKTKSCKLQVEKVMRPDRVEVLSDSAKSEWLVRIETREEVIRRRCDAPKNADDQTLRSAVQKAVYPDHLMGTVLYSTSRCPIFA